MSKPCPKTERALDPRCGEDDGGVGGVGSSYDGKDGGGDPLLEKLRKTFLLGIGWDEVARVVSCQCCGGGL